MLILYSDSTPLNFRFELQNLCLKMWLCGTAGYLSFGSIENNIMFCDLSVRDSEKAWHSRTRGAQAT